MATDANRRLLEAVLEPRKPNAMQRIVQAFQDGADPDGFCEDGSTLLTHSVHTMASRVVEKLLEAGADTNLRDRNGWTPWTASLLIGDGESKKATIQEMLVRSGAEQKGEEVVQLFRAVHDGDAKRFESLVSGGFDLKALPKARVDLLDHARRYRDFRMLELLLKHGMEPRSHDLTMAIKSRDLTAVDLFLRYGVDPNGEHEETPLMHAAALGELSILERLVEAGADVNRYAFGNTEWTAAFHAHRSGKQEVAQWLGARMDPALLEDHEYRVKARDPKFRALYEQATTGWQMDGDPLSTDALVQTLSDWDRRFGVRVSDVEPDGLTVHFTEIPTDLPPFWDEVRALCPDVLEGDDDEDVPSAVEKELVKGKSLGLWWD